jgi:hypothetical protein
MPGSAPPGSEAGPVAMKTVDISLYD